MVELSDAMRLKIGESLKNKSKIASEQERNQLLSELTENCDKRYRTSIDAVNRATSYLTWIIEAGPSYISIEEQEKYNTFFELKRNSAEQKAVEASGAEKAIASVISAGSIDELNHQSLIKNYIHTKNGQITIQKQIYEKESELGNIFIQFAQDYIRRHMLKIQEKTPESALTLAKAMKVIKQDSLTISDILQLNYQAMLNSIDQLQSHLSNRQEKLNILQKVIAHLNTMLESMNNEENNSAAPSTSTNRMAFVKK